MDSYWRPRNNSAAKGQPWAVNLYSSTMEDDDDDDDAEENSDEDADDEESTLDGTNIDTSMVYSEDTGSIRSRRSSSSTLPSTSPLGGGGELNDGASLVSNSSSLLTTDNYFHRYDPDSNYIFTDDDEESSSPAEGGMLSEAESAALRLTLPADFGSDSSSVKSPTEWANLNQELGRKFAKTLIQKARDAAEQRQPHFAPQSSDSETEDDFGTEWKRSPSRNRRKRRAGDKAASSSIIGRAVQALARRKKQYTASTSPLDTARTLETNSPSSIKSGESFNSSSPSAVDTRNALAEFGDWEAHLHRSASRSVSPMSCESNNIIAPRTLFCSDDEFDVDNAKFPIFEETSNFSDDDPVVIKAVKLIQLENGGGVMPFAAPRFRFDVSLLYDALEEQRSAEEVSQQLGLGEEGERVLQDLRSKMGMIDMDEDISCREKSFCRNIPLLEIQGGLWAPHYEEYVIRAVNDFARHLTTV